MMETTLVDLLDRAVEVTGIPHETDLGHGLRLQIMIHEGVTYLHLSRQDSFPTLEEMTELLQHWPYPVDRPQPKAVSHSGRYYLTAVLPLPPTFI